MAEYPRVFFGNLVNELMVAVPDERHTRALVAVAPRGIWLAEPGDLLVLPVEPTEPFWAYAHAVLGLRAGDVEVIVVDSTALRPPADLIREQGLLDRVRGALAARPGARVVPFALDRPSVDLFSGLGLPVDGYTSVPKSAVDTAYRLNTKSGFREWAGRLGLPLVPGRHCPDTGSLRAAVRELHEAHRGAVIKLDRGSNGFALLFLHPGQDSDRLLTEHLARFPSQPPGWVVEEYLDVDEVLTVEMWSHDSGPEVIHSGEMLTPGGRFSGQLTPPREAGAALDSLAEHGLSWGRHLHATGYRGPFDLDAVTADGRLYITETNVRRTGTTYLEHLVRRLTPDGRPVTWLADSRTGGRDLSFTEAVEALRAAGISHPGVRRTGVGVILTADTRASDRKWRFLVIGRDHDEVGDLEKRLTDVLGLG